MGGCGAKVAVTAEDLPQVEAFYALEMWTPEELNRLYAIFKRGSVGWPKAGVIPSKMAQLGFLGGGISFCGLSMLEHVRKFDAASALAASCSTSEQLTATAPRAGPARCESRGALGSAMSTVPMPTYVNAATSTSSALSRPRAVAAAGLSESDCATAARLRSEDATWHTR